MWPTPQDYNEAVQTPSVAFGDDELRRATPELNALGLPKPVSGSFASVYQLKAKTGAQWAVRCFLRNVPDQEQRYAHISGHLRANPLAYTVPFEFIRQGILIGGKWYPILKMQWVEGEPLTEWIQRHIDDAPALSDMRDRFLTMCRALADGGIAHGDLQHGNIFVADGALKLVDYDGMFVPPLASMGSVELGHRHYQHPRRNATHFGLYLDNFSGWSIYLSLQCLAQDPRLWRRLGAGEECLLFRQEDYSTPRHSIAFSFLEHHDSALVREASFTIRRLLTLDPGAIPPVGEPLVGAPDLSPLPPPAVPAGSPGGLVWNLRAAVAAANPPGAPTMVVAADKIRLVEDGDAPPRPASSQKSQWWQQNPAAMANTPAPPPPPTRQTVLVSSYPTYGRSGFIQKMGMNIVWLGLGASFLIATTLGYIHGVQKAQSPSQSTPQSSATSNDSYAVIANVNDEFPLSAKLRHVNASEERGIAAYKKGVSAFKEMDYTAAYKHFADAGNSEWQIAFDSSLCDFQMARCQIAKREYSTALVLLQSAQEAAMKYKFCVPELTYDLATAYLRLDMPNDAAKTYSLQVQFPVHTYRRAGIAGLREASVAALQRGDMGALSYYGQVFDLLRYDPDGQIFVPANKTVADVLTSDLKQVVSRLYNDGNKLGALQVANFAVLNLQACYNADKREQTLAYMDSFKTTATKLRLETQQPQPSLRMKPVNIVSPTMPPPSNDPATMKSQRGWYRQ
jgi:hypothetical protein